MRLVKGEHRAALVLWRRYTGVEAQAASLVDQVCPPHDLRETAVAVAGRLAGSEGLDSVQQEDSLCTQTRPLQRRRSNLPEPPRFYSRI